jgi:hypothetical protein
MGFGESAGVPSAQEAAMRAKSFFHVCLGILALVAAYHLGATTATAQAPGNPAVGITVAGNGVVYVLAADGSVWQRLENGPNWTPYGNPLNGPTPVQQQSWGAVKQRYR